MTRIFSSLILALLVLLSSLEVSAVESATSSELTIKSVKVLDNKNVRVTFSEAIDTDSVVLKIMKQSDNSTVKTDTISTVSDLPEAVDVGLDDVLTEASSYTLTVIAAIGKSGATVVDGATALQDFVTPSPLMIAGEATLNAPPNPNAVLTDTPPTTTRDNLPTATPREVNITEPAPTEELPLTGPSSILFLAIALLISYLLLRRKQA